MSLLHVVLEEGFDHEEVHISVDGTEVYGRRDVTTRLQTGLADLFETEVTGDNRAGVDITLPRQGQRRHIEVPLSQSGSSGTFLGISLADSGELRHRVTSEPFGYV